MMFMDYLQHHKTSKRFLILYISNLCEICCCNQKNSVFIPCMHSYTCKECAIMIRMKDPRCPVCRQSKFEFYSKDISDSLILNKEDNNNKNEEK